MCGRFTSLLSPELLTVIFELSTPPAIEPRYNIAPTQQASIIRSAGKRNELVSMRWGLVPSWARDTIIGNSLINARSETVAEKPSFRHAIKYNRCIIPASGFYEWAHIGGKKLPNYITMSNGGIMPMAGIYEHWTDPKDGNEIQTFSILTTSSNQLIAPLHDRMPVILRPEDFKLWLSKNMHDPAELTSLYTPVPPETLTMFRVTDRMNSPKYVDPDCIVQLKS